MPPRKSVNVNDSMTPEALEQLVTQRIATALAERDVVATENPMLVDPTELAVVVRCLILMILL